MRIYGQKHSSLVTALLLFAVIVAVGCPKPSTYRTPVSKFRDASTVVIQSTKIYLTELNKVERDQYIYEQANKLGQIQLNKIDEAQVFSKEGIAARLNALDQLANYADLLYELASSDAPGTIKAKASDLNTAMSNLSGQVKALSGKDDAQFKAASDKVFPLIGEVLQAFASQSIKDALRKAIETGTAPVNQLIEAIKSDVTVAYDRKRAGYSAARVSLIDQYNRELQKGNTADPAKLKVHADDISRGEDRWEAFLTAQPAEGLEAMKKANDALLKLAKTPKPGAADVAGFNDTMDSFSNIANRIGHSVQALTGK